MCVRVFYAFLNGWTDCDEIWHRDRLDLWGEYKLIYLKWVNSNPGRCSNRDYKTYDGNFCFVNGYYWF